MNTYRIDGQPKYDPAAVQPMRDELLAAGFEELFTPADVDAALGENPQKTILVVVNSVCGCSAGSARPGVNLALQHHRIPDRWVTVFAGQEQEAVAHLRRRYLAAFPPSSPCMALFRNGELVYFMPRHQIEGKEPGEIAAQLTREFDRFCSRKGPSVPQEDFDRILHYRRCSSTIPLYKSEKGN